MELRINKIKEVGEEVKAILNDVEIRAVLSKSVISAYSDFESEYENGYLHKVSSKLENALNVYLDESLDAETKLVSKIESYLSNLPLPKGIDVDRAANFKNDLAKLGLETLRVELKVFNINQEIRSIKSKNQLDEKQLANKILNYAEDLKRNIEFNKTNHEDVKIALSNNSLEGLDKAAKIINPNAKNYNENLDQEIEDFLNGGDLIL
ncbi:MAG: hypothetical protein ACOH2D_01715 [Gelidibacter sp.]